MNQGSCQCRAISYEFEGVPFNCCYCHCSICRKLTGSSMGTYGTVSKNSFKWTLGKEFISTYQQNKNLKRMFCSKCGSFLAGTHDLDPANIFISLGSLESKANLEIQYQQFVSSKAEWVNLDKDIKIHEEWPEWVYEKIGRKDA